MKVKKKIIQGTALFLAFVVSIIIVFSGAVFADEAYTDEYGNYVEWWNFRNAQDNNAVTGRPTPTNDKEAWGKWAAKYGTGWAAAPTPPIIVNEKLYIGVDAQILEIDKDTGEVLRRSEEMPGNVGYAMQSPIYADGKIFVAITNGRIAAVNLEDMTLAWTTDNSSIVRGQTVSPISYKKINGTGYVYTGTWTKDGGDLICASTDDSGVNNKIKALTWHFNPQKEDAENLEANNCVALGYYGTGAYVCEQYLAVGADNGSTLGDYVDDTAFYTLNPLTGEIIDVIYGIKGQVRSTTVFVDGYLYFTTKGAKIYKIAVDEEGHMGEPSYIDMKEFGSESTTATPVIYGGKIYLGLQGKGGQFNADGGHGFAVVKDDAVLSQDSFAYIIPVPGNPQAGALLSDYHVEEDFDHDEVADGRVYLFFTYNAPPGGIFYTYDTPDQTEPTQLSVEESKIFIPASSQQQYCISSIVVDEEGVLYYKNDSCYLFAVESNPAALSNIELMDENGQPLSFDQEFQPKIGEYQCVVETESEYVQLKLTLDEGVSATVDGVEYTGESVRINLPEEINEVRIITDKEGKNRTYLLTISKASVNCDLSSLGSAINNQVPSAGNTNTRQIYPQFRKEETSYTFDWITTGTGATTGTIDPATKPMMNIFLKLENPNAKVEVFPGENVDQPSSALNADGTVKRYAVSNDIYDSRYPVYSADVKRDSTARIVVTAEDGKTTKEYSITFNRRIYVNSISLNEETVELEKGKTITLLASTAPRNATDPTVTWSSSDEAVATVDETGTVTAVGAGTATITATSEDGPFAECIIAVPMDTKEIVITADSGEKKYDGTPLMTDTYTYTEGVLAEGDVLTAVVEGTITNVGTTANKVTSYKVMRGETDVTANYTFGESVNGTLEVTKRSVTLTSADDEKEYDGTALKNDTVTVSGDGFAEGEGATYAVTGTITDPGTAANAFTYTLNEGTMAGNYDIEVVQGTLTITKKWKEGWNLIDGKWYYYQNGETAKGWKKVNGTWYYMDKDTGIMQTGWVLDGNTWYFMNPSGAMAKGWVKVGNTWYYMQPSGAMMTGWLKDGSSWYYLKSSGAMAASEWCDGYWLNANGTWTYQPRGSWKKNSVGWWFGDTSGWYARNTTQRINNVNYTFNTAGYWVE